MNREKYSGDYRLRETVKNGRIIQTAEYIGEYYCFRIPAQKRWPAARRRLIFCAVSLVAYILPLCMTNRLSTVIYAVVPHICAAIPLWLLLSALLRIGFGREPMIHEHAEKAAQRYAAGVPAMICIAGVSVLADIFGVLSLPSTGLSVNDALFCICDIVMLLAGLCCLPFREIAEVAIIRDDSAGMA